MRRIRIHSPAKIKSQPTAAEKSRIKSMCEMFIELRLKEKWIKPFDPKNIKDMQVVDIYCKWRQNYIYFIVKYKVLRAHVISSEYEKKVARLEFINADRFCLSYLRHTEQWFDLTYGEGIRLKQCLVNIEEMPHFFA